MDRDVDEEMDACDDGGGRRAWSQGWLAGEFHATRQSQARLGRLNSGAFTTNHLDHSMHFSNAQIRRLLVIGLD
jgi:hypothetical protein